MNDCELELSTVDAEDTEGIQVEDQKDHNQDGIIVNYSPDRRNFFRTAAAALAVISGAVDCKCPWGEKKEEGQIEDKQNNRIELGRGDLPKVTLEDKEHFDKPLLPSSIDDEKLDELRKQLVIKFKKFFQDLYGTNFDDEVAFNQLINLFRETLISFDPEFGPFLRTYEAKLKKRGDTLFGYINQFLVSENLIVNFDIWITGDEKLQMTQYDFNLYPIIKVQEAYINGKHITDVYTLGDGLMNIIFFAPAATGSYNKVGDFNAAFVWSDRLPCFLCGNDKEEKSPSDSKKEINGSIYHEVIHAYLLKKYPFLEDLIRLNYQVQKDMKMFHDGGFIPLDYKALAKELTDLTFYMRNVDELCAHGAETSIAEKKESVMRYLDLEDSISTYRLTGDRFRQIVYRNMLYDPSVDQKELESTKFTDLSKKMRRYLLKKDDMGFLRQIGVEMYKDGIISIEFKKQKILELIKKVSEERKSYEDAGWFRKE